MKKKKKKKERQFYLPAHIKAFRPSKCADVFQRRRVITAPESSRHLCNSCLYSSALLRREEKTDGGDIITILRRSDREPNLLWLPRSQLTRRSQFRPGVAGKNEKSFSIQKQTSSRLCEPEIQIEPCFIFVFFLNPLDLTHAESKCYSPFHMKTNLLFLMGPLHSTFCRHSAVPRRPGIGRILM